MGLSRCEECGTIDGEWKTCTITESMAHVGLGGVGETYIRCEECGGVECRQDIPEHDDYDWER